MINNAKTVFQSFLKLVGIITLALSGAMLLVAAVSLIGASILNLIGVTNAPFKVGGVAVGGFVQVIIAVVISAGLLALSFLCGKGIKKLRS